MVTSECVRANITHRTTLWTRIIHHHSHIMHME